MKKVINFYRTRINWFNVLIIVGMFNLLMLIDWSLTTFLTGNGAWLLLILVAPFMGWYTQQETKVNTVSNEDKWQDVLDEFRSTDDYKKSNGQLLMPKFYEFLYKNYKSPNKL